jgi:hypothetical protein
VCHRSPTCRDQQRSEILVIDCLLDGEAYETIDVIRKVLADRTIPDPADFNVILTLLASSLVAILALVKPSIELGNKL